MSSVRLFYCQRLGIYMELDPTVKMMAFVAPAVAIVLLYPLFSLLIMTSYFREYVIVSILLLICLTGASIRLYFEIQERLKKQNSRADVIKKLYKNDNQDLTTQGEKEHDQIIVTAILTSWIAPCTLWNCQSYFLLVLSSVTTFGHSLGILSSYLFACFGDMTKTSHPPILHCFVGNNGTFERLSFPCINFSD